MRTTGPARRAGRPTGHARSLRLTVPAVALLGLLLAGCSDDGGDEPGANGGGTASPGASATSSPGAAATTAPAGPAPPEDTSTPSVGISTAPAVAIGKPAELTDAGVTVVVDRVREVTTGPVPGEVAGPAIAVRVTVRNAATAPFDLTGLVVTASFGKDEVPGDNSAAKPAEELRGTLAAGQTARGTYVFHIPAVGKKNLKLQVSSGQSPKVLVFTD